MDRDYSEHESVFFDIEDIFDFIAAHDPHAAGRVYGAIRATISDIRNKPEMSPPYTPRTFQNPNLRRRVVLPYTSFQVFYELTEMEIRILYVQHGARDFERRHRLEGRR